MMEPQIAQDQIEIRGEMESAGAENTSNLTSDEVSGPETTFEAVPEEQTEAPPTTAVRTYIPSAPVELREKSTRIRKPPDRLNLVAQKLPISTWKEGIRGEWSLMTVTRALKLFLDKATAAIESEVKSLLAKGTFSGVHMEQLSPTQKQKILRSNMNVVEQYLPTVNSDGDRQIDKVKARFCVDGRAQVREDYAPDEVESPTASIAAIFTVAQIAAVEIEWRTTEVCEKSDGSREACDICCVMSRSHWFSVYVSIHFGYEYILGTTVCCDWKFAGEVSTNSVKKR